MWKDVTLNRVVCFYEKYGQIKFQKVLVNSLFVIFQVLSLFQISVNASELRIGYVNTVKIFNESREAIAAKDNKDATQKFIAKANSIVKKIAEQNNIDFILQEAVFVDPRLDITNTVLNGLDGASLVVTSNLSNPKISFLDSKTVLRQLSTLDKDKAITRANQTMLNTAKKMGIDIVLQEAVYIGKGLSITEIVVAAVLSDKSEDQNKSSPVIQANKPPVTQPIGELTKVRPEMETAQQIENNRLKIQAENAQRKLAELEAQLNLTKQQTASQVMTTMANRRALVIGNDTYKTVSKLLNAREDAKAIAASLITVGYQVTLKLDLNEKELKAALRAFSSQVQGGDEVLFFFAGHGVQLGAANYLLPTDIGSESEAQVKDEAIQLQRVLDDMTEKKAKFTLAVIDACRDNPFKTLDRAIGGRGLAPTTAATGQMIVFSAGTGQKALNRLSNNDKNKNGVFTRTLLKEIQKPGISIDRIVKNVRNEVAELAKTVGHEQVPAIYDQVLGDFYFKK
jgi:Skp family chaperone for outer membrane proteins